MFIGESGQECYKFRKAVIVYLGNFSPRCCLHRVRTTMKLLCYIKQYPARDPNLCSLFRGPRESVPRAP
jgi:hypothetical protein